uniref:hypothetical protein n=1 Tax=Sphingobacterium luzhongxinii TaxID=2654181 RepID=UPI0013D925CD
MTSGEVGRSAGRTGEDRGSLRSAQGLPLSGLDSFKTRSIPDGSPMNPRSPSGRDRRTIGSSSGKSGICPGSGRYPVGTLFTYLSAFARYFVASEAKDRQTIDKEQAKRQQSPEKEPQIGNAFAGGNEVSDRREVVTLFAPCSPLVRPLFGKCLPILYRFSTDCLLFLYVFCRETVDKHRTEGRAVPKRLRSSSEQGMDRAPAKCRSGKDEVLAKYLKKASSLLYSASDSVAKSIARASGLGRTCVQSCSTVVRPLFESCSTASRSPVEA